MNQEDLDIKLGKLDIKDKDILVFTVGHSHMRDDFFSQISNSVKKLSNERGITVSGLVLPEGISVERLSEENKARMLEVLTKKD
jgi:hypothetical protein